MTYVPDPRDYQQLAEPKTGRYDCTAYGAAFRVDAHSKGAIKTTGRQVRLRSDEPVPNPASPGLNLGQVDASVIDITNGRVDFDTRAQSRALPRAEVKWRIKDGRFCGLSITRGVLVDRGFVSGFRGAHDITVFTRDTEPDQPIMFDSLIPSLTRVSWDVVFDAANALTPGYIYAQFTRDLTPDYRAVIPPHSGTDYYQYHLDAQSRIRDTTARNTPGGVTARCSVPSYHGSVVPGISGRYLVMLTEGPNKGRWINARFASEINP